ncbi:MAG: hypothetical protein ACREAB_20210, partial [Blastocatellia bacterium]
LYSSKETLCFGGTRWINSLVGVAIALYLTFKAIVGASPEDVRQGSPAPATRWAPQKWPVPANGASLRNGLGKP